MGHYPRQDADRLRGGAVIFCNGVPKAGTHLLISHVMQAGWQLHPDTVKGYGSNLTGLPDPIPEGNWCCHTHVPAKHQLPGPVLTIFRHPRDTLVSYCRYTGASFEEALQRYYSGRPFIDLYREFLPWRERGPTYYFELLPKTRDSRTYTGQISDWRKRWDEQIDGLWREAGGPELEQELGYTI